MTNNVFNFLQAYKKHSLLNCEAAEQVLRSYDMAWPEQLMSVHKEFLADAMCVLNTKIGKMVKEKASAREVWDTVDFALDRAAIELSMRGIRTPRSSDDERALRQYLTLSMLDRLGTTLTSRCTSLGVTGDPKQFLINNPCILFDPANEELIKKRIANGKEWYCRSSICSPSSLCQVRIEEARHYVYWNKLDWTLQEGDWIYGYYSEDGPICLLVVRHAPSREDFCHFPNGPQDIYALEYFHVLPEWAQWFQGYASLLALQDMFGYNLAMRLHLGSSEHRYGLNAHLMSSPHKAIYAIDGQNAFVQYMQMQTDVNGPCCTENDDTHQCGELLCREVLHCQDGDIPRLLPKLLDLAESVEGLHGEMSRYLLKCDSFKDTAAFYNTSLGEVHRQWNRFCAAMRRHVAGRGWRYALD